MPRLSIFFCNFVEFYYFSDVMVKEFWQGPDNTFFWNVESNIQKGNWKKRNREKNTFIFSEKSDSEYSSKRRKSTVPVLKKSKKSKRSQNKSQKKVKKILLIIALKYCLKFKSGKRFCCISNIFFWPTFLFLITFFNFLITKYSPKPRFDLRKLNVFKKFFCFKNKKIKDANVTDSQTSRSAFQNQRHENFKNIYKRKKSLTICGPIIFNIISRNII